MNHYPHHIGDFLRKTVGLDWLEYAAYRKLLDWYYVEERPLPLEQRELWRCAGAETKQQRAAVDYVVGRYFEKQQDGWHNARADEEIAAYQGKADKARENGVHGGRPRAHQTTDDAQQKGRHETTQETESVIPENQSGSFSGTETKANQEPRTKNQEPRKVKSGKTKGMGAPPALPEWVPVEPWERFREMRKAKGKGMTPYAEELAVRKLLELRQSGNDPLAVLEQSIFNSWAGLFPVRQNGSSASNSGGGSLSVAGQQTQENLKRWLEKSDASH